MNHSLLCLSYPPAKKAGEKIEERKPSFMQDVKTNPRAHCIKRAFVNPPARRERDECVDAGKNKPQSLLSADSLTRSLRSQVCFFRCAI